MSRNHGGFESLPVAGFVRGAGRSREPSAFPRMFTPSLASTGSSRRAHARPDAALVPPNRPQPRAFYLTPEEPHPSGSAHQIRAIVAELPRPPGLEDALAICLGMLDREPGRTPAQPPSGQAGSPSSGGHPRRRSADARGACHATNR